MFIDKELEELNKKLKGNEDDQKDAIDYMSTRSKCILKIDSVEKFDFVNEGEAIELNDGYSFEVNGAIPEIADGIAKMALEMDKMEDLGENAGRMFINIISEFYNKLKEVN